MPLQLPSDETQAPVVSTTAISGINGQLLPLRRHMSISQEAGRTGRKVRSLLHESSLGAITGTTRRVKLRTVQSMPYNRPSDLAVSSQGTSQCLLGKPESKETLAMVDGGSGDSCMQQHAALYTGQLDRFFQPKDTDQLDRFFQQKEEGFASSTAMQKENFDRSEKSFIETTPPIPHQQQALLTPTTIQYPLSLVRTGLTHNQSSRDKTRGNLANECEQAVPKQQGSIPENSETLPLKSQSIAALNTTLQESLNPISSKEESSLKGPNAMILPLQLPKQDIYLRAAAAAAAEAVAAAAALEQLRKSPLYNTGVLDFDGINVEASQRWTGRSPRDSARGSPRDAAREWLASARLVGGQLSSRGAATCDSFSAAIDNGGRGAANNDRNVKYGGWHARSGDSSSQGFPFLFTNDVVLAAGSQHSNGCSDRLSTGR